MRTATPLPGRRADVMYGALFDCVALTVRSRFLELGCGSGDALAAATRRGADVAGIDVDGKLLHVARHRVPRADIRHGSAGGIPFADQSFDVVASFTTNWIGDLGALEEVRRVVCRGGRVALAISSDPDAASFLRAGLWPRSAGVPGFVVADAA